MQGGGQDVGHHHRAHTTLLLLSERAGLGHANRIKHHQGILAREEHNDRHNTSRNGLTKGRFMVLR